MISELLISNLIGLVVGICASLLAWWILFHAIVPKISFATAISKLKTDDDASGWRYRIKYKNIGRRALLDVQVLARISIKGLTRPGNWVAVNIPLEWSGETKAKMPKLSKGNNRVLRLFVSHAADLKHSTLYPSEIRQKANENRVTLEDLFVLGTESKLVIWIFGYDEFSGSRRLFKSSDYVLSDIKEGCFKELDVVPNDNLPDAGSSKHNSSTADA